MENRQTRKQKQTQPSFNAWRKQIYTIIEPFHRSNKASALYDYLMIVVIFVSIFPLMFKNDTVIFELMDKIAATIFIIDYALRWITADFKLKDKSAKSFLRYPFTPMAIIDLLSILPSFTMLNGSFKLVRLIRFARIARLVRLLKLVRYSRSMQLVLSAAKRAKEPLIFVVILAVSYILIAALVVFNVEPDSFDNYFDAIFWVVTLWYFQPTTIAGRVVAIFSVFFGTAVVALPAGIITASYISEINARERRRELRKEEKAAEEAIKETAEAAKEAVEEMEEKIIEEEKHRTKISN